MSDPKAWTIAPREAQLAIEVAAVGALPLLIIGSATDETELLARNIDRLMLGADPKTIRRPFPSAKWTDLFGSALHPERQVGELGRANDGALVLENVDAFETRIVKEVLRAARNAEIVRARADAESRTAARAWVVATTAACGCECCSPDDTAECPAPREGLRRKTATVRTFAGHPPIIAMITTRALPAQPNSMQHSAATVARAREAAMRRAGALVNTLDDETLRASAALTAEARALLNDENERSAPDNEAWRTRLAIARCQADLSLDPQVRAAHAHTGIEMQAARSRWMATPAPP